MTVEMRTLSVSPHPRQFSGTPGDPSFTPTFVEDVPFYEGVTLEITASGQIGSGYLCTGLTPPGGWSEQDVSGNTDFPFHSVRAHPQCLIGTLDRGVNWFFIGSGLAIPISSAAASLPPFGVGDTIPALPSGGPSTPDWPPPTHQLAFAVNRTQPTIDVAGDHQWDVTVKIVTPDWIPDNPTDPTGPHHWDASQACTLLTRQVHDEQGVNASDACVAFTTALRAVGDRWTIFNIASAVAGGCMIAAVTFAAAIAAVDATARAGAQQARASAIGSIIQAWVANPAGAADFLARLITPTVSIDALMTALNKLWEVATVGSSPLAQQPWTGIVVWGLVIASAIAAVIAVGLLLSQLTLAADSDNALSNWKALLSHVQSILDALTDLRCPAPPDVSLPTCPAVMGG